MVSGVLLQISPAQMVGDGSDGCGFLFQVAPVGARNQTSLRSWLVLKGGFTNQRLLVAGDENWTLSR